MLSSLPRKSDRLGVVEHVFFSLLISLSQLAVSLCLQSLFYAQLNILWYAGQLKTPNVTLEIRVVCSQHYANCALHQLAVFSFLLKFHSQQKVSHQAAQHFCLLNKLRLFISILIFLWSVYLSVSLICVTRERSRVGLAQFSIDQYLSYNLTEWIGSQLVSPHNAFIVHFFTLWWSRLTFPLHPAYVLS